MSIVRVETIAELQNAAGELLLARAKESGGAGGGAQPGTLGLVPTMGALHHGHASLARAAAAENSVVMASVCLLYTSPSPRD